MFAIIAALGMFKAKMLAKKSFPKILLVVFCLVGTKCLFDSTFTTSLILLVVGVVLVMITQKDSKATNIAIYLTVLASAFFISRFVGSFLMNVSLESEDVTVRLHEIGGLLMGESGGTNTDSRFEYFIKSVKCFMEYPILGYNYAILPTVKTGGHSEWMDIFGVYGLVGGIPLIATILIKVKRIAKITKQVIKYPFYAIVVFVFLIFGFVDPFLRLYHIGFVMFLIIPCMGCITDAFEKKVV